MSTGCEADNEDNWRDVSTAVTKTNALVDGTLGTTDAKNKNLTPIKTVALFAVKNDFPPVLFLDFYEIFFGIEEKVKL